MCVRSKYLLQILHAAISSTTSGRCIPKCSLWFIENCGNEPQKNSHLKYNCVLKWEVENVNLFFGTHLHRLLYNHAEYPKNGRVGESIYKSFNWCTRIGHRVQYLFSVLQNGKSSKRHVNIK